MATPKELLDKITYLLDEMDRARLARALELLRVDLDPEFAFHSRIYAEYLPKGAEPPMSKRVRCLQFLWEALDISPCHLDFAFAQGLRRAIASRLFKRCGKSFICESGVRFNIGPNIEVGDDVFLNRGVYLDSKGGISIGDSVGIAEEVMVFTHTHSESRHRVRDYKPVRIGSFVKFGARSMVLPGVRIGDQALVAAMAVVHHDVEENMVVAGIPARPVRERRTEGRTGADLEHVWLHQGAFQEG